jgi:hypothetical protein
MQIVSILCHPFRVWDKAGLLVFYNTVIPSGLKIAHARILLRVIVAGSLRHRNPKGRIVFILFHPFRVWDKAGLLVFYNTCHPFGIKNSPCEDFITGYRRLQFASLKSKRTHCFHFVSPFQGLG